MSFSQRILKRKRKLEMWTSVRRISLFLFWRALSYARVNCITYDTNIQWLRQREKQQKNKGLRMIRELSGWTAAPLILSLIFTVFQAHWNFVKSIELLASLCKLDKLPVLSSFSRRILMRVFQTAKRRKLQLMRACHVEGFDAFDGLSWDS